MGKLNFCLVFLLLISPQAFAGAGGTRKLSSTPAEKTRAIVPATGTECPTWAQGKDVPVCPASDNGILSDNYPALAHVVADHPFRASPATQDFAATFVVSALKKSNGQTPLMFLPMPQASFDKVRKAVEAAAGDDEAKKKEWLGSLVWVKDGSNNTWQQDYFESFNGEDGIPRIRPIRDYPHTSVEKADALITAMGRKCKMLTQGEVLPPPGVATAASNSRMGGNIEGLPGGLCLHGNTQDWEGFAKHYCGSRDNEVVIDTEWLNVGHADEIVSTIRKPGAKQPCDFAIAIASPRRAIELIEGNPKDVFWDFHSSGEKKEDTRKRRLGQSPFSMICAEVHRYYEKKESEEISPETRPGPTPKKDFHGDESKSGFFWDIRKLFVREAWAGLTFIPPAPPKGAPKCNDVTNKHLSEALKDPDSILGNLNRLIQITMDKNKAVIEKKIQERLPQCSVDFIEVPNLFAGGTPVEKRGSRASDPIEKRFELPKNMAKGLTPNPTNGVQFSQGALLPHPQNSAFAKDIKENYQKKAGMDVTFIDSAEYAHIGDGNVHCASHSIRFCRGKEK